MVWILKRCSSLSLDPSNLSNTCKVQLWDIAKESGPADDNAACQKRHVSYTAIGQHPTLGRHELSNPGTKRGKFKSEQLYFLSFPKPWVFMPLKKPTGHAAAMARVGNMQMKVPGDQTKTNKKKKKILTTIIPATEGKE